MIDRRSGFQYREIRLARGLLCRQLTLRGWTMPPHGPPGPGTNVCDWIGCAALGGRAVVVVLVNAAGVGIVEAARWRVPTLLGSIPRFQPNPGGCQWHIEVDGRIVARGTGIRRMLKDVVETGAVAHPVGATALADRITLRAREAIAAAVAAARTPPS